MVDDYIKKHISKDTLDKEKDKKNVEALLGSGNHPEIANYHRQFLITTSLSFQKA